MSTQDATFPTMPIDQYLAWLPFLAGWLEEIERSKLDVEGISIEHDIERDLEKEKRIQDHYKHWKYGNFTTVKLTMKDSSVYSKSFPRNEWDAMFPSEYVPE